MFCFFLTNTAFFMFLDNKIYIFPLFIAVKIEAVEICSTFCQYWSKELLQKAVCFLHVALGL
mgnify:CR=1 FL=1